ncbi:MAG TPA: glycogen/starch synthase [Anaerolineales bacterium]|nr:glycogen/starch synthase [Anaerolineales bacterium]
MPGSIAFITYETPFAPCGGVAAVMGQLPSRLATATGSPTFVITPFHYKIDRTISLENQMREIGQVQVQHSGTLVAISVLMLERDGAWIFLKPESLDYFSGTRHPYDVGQTQIEIAVNLLRDALLFGVAVSRALPLISPGASWKLMTQDWEAATAVMALSASPLANIQTYLTLHNSYDSGVTDQHLLDFGINPTRCPGSTVLDRALPLVQLPVFTVSDQFALDLTNEILQAEVMAPHLKHKLAPRLVGINNGPFTSLAIDIKALHQAKLGDYNQLHAWKAAKRENALQALDTFTPTAEKPIWGDLARFKRDDAPWFVMAGRDDSRQKGYDIAFSAIAGFLKQPDRARFLFFPIPGDEDLAGLSFLKKLAQEFPESVLVLPFLFKEGFMAALQGANFGIMPSLYEPFGMANEFYLNGTLGIGRATGGILQQIVPLRSAASFSHAVQTRTQLWYGASAFPTGLLYRERDDLPSAVMDWQAINASQYDLNGSSLDRIQGRQPLSLIKAMVKELQLAILDGVYLFQERPELYYQMLIEGVAYIQRTFSWERSAQAYARYLD